MSQTSRPKPPLASISRRVQAYLIDVAIAVVISIVAALIGWLVGGSATGAWRVLAVLGVAAILGFAWALVYTAMQGGRGSLGQRARGIRLVRASDASPIGFGLALLRNVVWGLAAQIVVGYFTPLMDSMGRRQGWHDKAVGSVVVEARDTADAVPEKPAPPVAEPVAPTGPVVPHAPILPPPLGSEAGRPSAPSSMPSSLPPTALPVEPVQRAGVISHVPGVTVDPVPAPVADAAEPAPADPAPVEPAPANAVPDATVSLVWDDGSAQPVHGRTLVGRNPAAETGAALAPVRDDTLSLSKTHFEVGLDAGEAWILDRHSTNGVVLERDGDTRRLTAGERTTLRPGDVLRFGDRHARVETLS